MKRRFVLTPEAKADLREILLDIADDSPAANALSREVNPTVYRTEDFFRKTSERKHFLTRVLDGPLLFVLGTEGELRRIAKERVAKGPGAKRGFSRVS